MGLPEQDRDHPGPGVLTDIRDKNGAHGRPVQVLDDERTRLRAGYYRGSKPRATSKRDNIDPEDELGHTIDDNERGLKDTVRVNPNEMVEIAVRFTAYSGRYMYHCHILEHEDRDMMRPFVTMPRELMPFMA